jgi:uncharacterized membrane protein
MATTGSAPQPSEQDPLRHYEHYQDGNQGSPYAGGSSFMERLSESVASGMGTVGFLLVSTGVILAWVLANHVIHFLSNPAPFILLNLVFSAVAFFTGALVIIAQKAQTRTDKANERAAATHRDELAQSQDDLLQKNTDLTEQIHTLTTQLHSLTEQVHAATCGRSSSA